MNFSALPDFVAIGGLVAVFWTLLRRTRQSRLNFWLVGWVLLLVHIIALFVAANTPGSADGAYSVAVAMLVVIANIFMWASGEQLEIRARTLSIAVFSAVPDAVLLSCVQYGVTAPWMYAATTIAGTGSMLWMMRAWRSANGQPTLRWRTSLVLSVYAVQGALLAFGHPNEALTWMLTWHYLAVAALYRMTAPRASASVRFTMISFIAWAFVFPAADLMAVLWPHAHVDAEVWNLPKFLVATGMTFTLLEEQLSKAEYASLHDALTGLPNRRLLVRRLHEAMARARAAGTQLALVVIDLDGFKEINDTFGHLTGDAVLRDMAILLQQKLRKTDTTLAALKHYRFGGDEFVVIAPHTSLAGAKILADRLDQAVREFSFTTHDGQPLKGSPIGPVSASIGYASYPEETSNADELLDLADKRMYSIKESRSGGKLRALPAPPSDGGWLDSTGTWPE